MPRANLEQLTARWSTQHAQDVVLVMIRRDLSQNDGQGLGSVLRSFKFPHVEEVKSGRDLRCISLEGEELPDANLSRADLGWASLAESTLRGANLTGANLSRACLAGANLAGANLSGADCRRTDFTRANLADVDFSGARLDGAVFEEAYSARGVYKNAVVTRVNMRGANLDATNFEGSDLSGSNLSYGGLDAITKPPAASDDLVYDLSREEFEAQAGLKGEPIRASKRLRAIRPQLRQHANEDHASRRGGQKARRSKQKQPQPRTQILQPPPATDQLPRPELPPATQILKRGAPALPPRPIRGGTGKLRRPTDTRNRSRRSPRPPLPVRPPRPPTRTVQRPPSTATPGPLPEQPPPPEPVVEPVAEVVSAEPTFAPLNEDAQPPHPEWAAAIGELMRLKPTVTKIAIELGDASRLLFDARSS